MLGQATGNTDSFDSPRPGLGGSHHLPPYSILAFAHGTYIWMVGTPKEESWNWGGVPKLFQFGLPGLWELITPDSNLWLGWGLKHNCTSPQELSNSGSHSTCTYRNQVDSWLLVVGNQIGSLTPGPSFNHNLYYKCPNGSCETMLDIYTSRTFQGYKEHLNARCFDHCNQALNFWEFRRTPSSHFWECEFHLHTCLKVGLRQVDWIVLRTIIVQKFGDVYANEICVKLDAIK